MAAMRAVRQTKLRGSASLPLLLRSARRDLTVDLASAVARSSPVKGLTAARMRGSGRLDPLGASLR